MVTIQRVVGKCRVLVVAVVYSILLLLLLMLLVAPELIRIRRRWVVGSVAIRIVVSSIGVL